MSKAKTQTFDEFIKAASTKTANTPIWDSWPKAVHAEVGRVLDLNDSGKAHVTAEAMVKRLTEVHKVRASIDIMKRYVRAVFGRKSWSVR